MRFVSGYINKNEILDKITQEEIFEYALGFYPEPHEYICSPLREDNSPGCWFEYSSNGSLKFVDYASEIFTNGVQMVYIDCFSFIQNYYNLSNFFQSLQFIKTYIIDKSKPRKEIRPYISKKKPVEIFLKTREFQDKDKEYWSNYNIKEKHLIEDKVLPVDQFLLKNTRKGDLSFSTKDICYAYTNFSGNKKKLYRPKQIGKYRFITNCSPNDIGAVNKLRYNTDTLVITKSYKDRRVIQNLGYETIWFHNEGAIPKLDILKPILSRYNNVMLFFDNDRQGLSSLKKVGNQLDKVSNNSIKRVHLPEQLYKEGIKDPADMVKNKGMNCLNQFLQNVA